MRLLKDHLPSMLKKIREHELFQTFQDALKVTRRLGQRYIWIDALCIVRDDPEDWQAESTQMNEIYFRSVCYISAAAASGEEQGLFYPRDSTLLEPAKITATTNGSKHIFYMTSDHEEWEREVARSPLNRRAWVCKSEYYPHAACIFAEISSFGNVKIAKGRKLFDRLLESLIYKRSTANCIKDPTFFDVFPNEVDQTWGDLIQTYTGARLTYAKDKMVAIGGLGRRWAKITNDMYIAGLDQTHMAL